MNVSPEILEKLYLKITLDSRTTVWHISLYAALLYLWSRSGFDNRIKVSRKQLMKLARFKSFVTYHKCIVQLQNYNYIKYSPSYDHYLGSQIEINHHPVFNSQKPL
jgi:hypothetical protein